MIRLLAVLVVVFQLSSMADEGKKKEVKKPAKSKETLASEFRCERIRDAALGDLKTAMLENCDLNKPFGVSSTDIGVSGSYMYCCHTLAE